MFVSAVFFIKHKSAEVIRMATIHSHEAAPSRPLCPLRALEQRRSGGAAQACGCVTPMPQRGHRTELTPVRRSA